jgi:hypothetical protein
LWALGLDFEIVTADDALGEGAGGANTLVIASAISRQAAVR